MIYAREVVQKQMNDKHVMLKKKVLLAKYWKYNFFPKLSGFNG